jgi:hypothetical protein
MWISGAQLPPPARIPARRLAKPGRRTPTGAARRYRAALAQTSADGALLLKFPRYFQAIDRNDNISGPKLIRSTSDA